MTGVKKRITDCDVGTAVRQLHSAVTQKVRATRRVTPKQKPPVETQMMERIVHTPSETHHIARKRAGAAEGTRDTREPGPQGFTRSGLSRCLETTPWCCAVTERSTWNLLCYF